MPGPSRDELAAKRERARVAEKHKTLWHLAKRGDRGAKRLLLIKGGKK